MIEIVIAVLQIVGAGVILYGAFLVILHGVFRALDDRHSDRSAAPARPQDPQRSLPEIH